MTKQTKKPTKKRPMKITPKVRAFINEYPIDINGTRAAERAGFSMKTANEQASRMLADVNIRAEVDKLLKEQQERAKMTADEVLRGLANIARFDIRKLYNKDGSLLPVHELPDEVALAISSIEVDEKTADAMIGGKVGIVPVNVLTKKIKACSKERAYELVGKHFKLFTDKIDHRLTDKDGKDVLLSEEEIDRKIEKKVKELKG